MKKVKKREKILASIAAVLIIIGILFIIIGEPSTEDREVIINLQTTEYKNPEALSWVIDELEARDIRPGTIFVGPEMAEESCQLLRELDEKGYEIAVFGYYLDEERNFVQIATLSGEKQREIIERNKESIENCLGKEIIGFRAQRFSKNSDTHEIVRDLGFMWHGSFIVNSDREAFIYPYYSYDHGVYIVSIESAEEAGTVICDTAMAASGKTAEEWRTAVQEVFIRHQKDGTPFVTEIHPYFFDENPEWEEEFIELIDWMENQNANFLTTKEFILELCPVCGE